MDINIDNNFEKNFSLQYAMFAYYWIAQTLCAKAKNGKPTSSFYELHICEDSMLNLDHSTLHHTTVRVSVVNQLGYKYQTKWNDATENTKR